MEAGFEKREKTKNGVPAVVKYFFLLPLVLGISLVPSMIDSKTFYKDFHSMIFDPSDSRQLSTTVPKSDIKSNMRSSKHDGAQHMINDTINRDPHNPNNPNHDGTSDTATTTTTRTAAHSSNATTTARISSDELHDNPRTENSLVQVPHFEKQEGVVIVTQIHGPHQYGLLRQSFCLLHKAYNSRLLYDLVVFLAEPLSSEQEKEVKQIVHPATLNFVNNTPQGFHGMIEELSPERRNHFLKRCNVKNATEMYNLTWWSDCPGRLAYSWQAEFRSLRIWRQPALAKYKYMVWLDSDVFATGVWKYDPVAYMVAHDLVVLFGHYGGGRARPGEVTKVREFYNKGFCAMSVTEDGYLHSPAASHCSGGFSVIHGFFHITNLDFYRTDEVQRWLTHFREGCFLCREFDDQAAMTVPPAMLAPNRSKDMRKSGLILNNFHNAAIDGQIQAKPAGFKAYWRAFGSNFTEAHGVCAITEAG